VPVIPAKAGIQKSGIEKQLPRFIEKIQPGPMKMLKEERHTSVHKKTGQTVAGADARG